MDKLTKTRVQLLIWAVVDDLELRPDGMNLFEILFRAEEFFPQTLPVFHAVSELIEMGTIQHKEGTYTLRKEENFT
jgi:hypothetical protein